MAKPYHSKSGPYRDVLLYIRLSASSTSSMPSTISDSFEKQEETEIKHSRQSTTSHHLNTLIH